MFGVIDEYSEPRSDSSLDSLAAESLQTTVLYSVVHHSTVPANRVCTHRVDYVCSVLGRDEVTILETVNGSSSDTQFVSPCLNVVRSLQFPTLVDAGYELARSLRIDVLSVEQIALGF